MRDIKEAHARSEEGSADDVSAGHSDTLLWSCLIAFALSRSIAGATTFTSITIILNGMLADRQGIGFFNGINDSLSALGRSLAPTATGALFATMTQPPVADWPFNEHLPFYCVSALCTVALLLSTRFVQPSGGG